MFEKILFGDKLLSSYYKLFDFKNLYARQRFGDNVRTVINTKMFLLVIKLGKGGEVSNSQLTRDGL